MATNPDCTAILLRNVPRDLHQRLLAEARENGMTLRGLCLRKLAAGKARAGGPRGQ